MRADSRDDGAVLLCASWPAAVVRLDLGIVGGKRHRKTVYGRSEHDVLEKLRTLRAARDHGLDLLATSLTAGQWLDAWLSTSKASMAHARRL